MCQVFFFFKVAVLKSSISCYVTNKKKCNKMLTMMNCNLRQGSSMKNDIDIMLPFNKTQHLCAGLEVHQIMMRQEVSCNT